MGHPTPITASHRLTLPYNVASVQHKLRHYVLALPSSGDPTTWGLSTRSGTIGVTTIFNAWQSLLQQLFSVNTVLGQGLLEVRNSDGSYSPIAAPGSAVNGTVGASELVAFQYTIVQRNVLNQKLQTVIIEPMTNIFAHGISPATPPAVSFVSVTKAYAGTGTASTTTDPYAWVLSRNGDDATRFIGWTMGPNRKMRRRRGLL